MRALVAISLLTWALFAACGGRVVVDQAAGASSGTGGTATGAGGASGATVGTGGGVVIAGSGGGPVVSSGSGVTPPDAKACLARPTVCAPAGPPPHDAKATIDELIGQCGAKLGCPNECVCGNLSVALDSNGCATGLEHPFGNQDIIACLAKRLDEVRFACAASTTVTNYQPCTTPM